MANPFYKTYSLTGTQDPWNADWQLELFQTTVGVYVSNPGTTQYSIEYTMDDLTDASVTPRWFTEDSFPVGTTASKAVVIWTQFRFLRVNIAVLVGTLELKIIQGLRWR